MNARDVMTSQNLWTCRIDSTCQQAAALMCDHDIGSLPVIDNTNKVEGVITDRDICCRAFAKGKAGATLVSQVMTRGAQCVRPDASIEEVESLMKRHQIRRVPVVDSNSRLVGVISLADISHACHREHHEAEAGETLEAVSTPSAERMAGV